MGFPVRLELFEGPLDLLLFLVREHRVEIRDIPIAEITEQYLGAIALMDALDLDVAGEYLVVAATLMEIKSRELLPRPPAPVGLENGPDPREELVARLEEYARIRGAAEELRELQSARQLLFTRSTAADAGRDAQLPRPLAELAPADLLRALERVLGGLEAEPVTVVQRERINLKLVMRSALRRIRACSEGLPFRALFPPAAGRLEILVHFLALLELIRQGVVRATQHSADDEIVLWPAGEPPRAVSQ
jgi:segregation and condensation protein A